MRIGVQWCDLPDRCGPWQTVYGRHRLWPADGTGERLLQQIPAAADAAGDDALTGWSATSLRTPPARSRAAAEPVCLTPAPSTDDKIEDPGARAPVGDAFMAA
ncbi:hypothetical protein GCM10010211_65560 [Streptomyces albospinus]|uniref:Insertion element IS402-like domain-containing protein n=1 Tax=Streptomyces albospinus TaxID=285515 RepID=A0ABQ2VIV2_9ACTN|nr:hypothetical protein GCM10010211_65560 [Streptomyces albospinus]